MAAQTRTVLLCLAALCLPALANVPRPSLLSEKPHQGVGSFTLASHRSLAVANALIAPGIAGCLCDEGRRSRSTGKERDLETGLDYFGARYMSSAQGRFTSPDAPFADQKPEDPQSWNLYGYVRNNPLRYTDPTGRCLYPGADCFQYLIGGAKGVANFASEAATLLNRGINALSGSNIPDAPRLEGTNYDQRAGMEAAGFAMLLTPLAEAGAARISSAISGSAKVAEIAGTGAKVEASITGIAPKLGEAGGPGAGKAFPNAVKDAARTESSSACVFCGQSTQRTAGPAQSNIDHAIPKSRGGNNTLNNAQNACRTCNLDKGTRTTQEYQEGLRRQNGGN